MFLGSENANNDTATTEAPFLDFFGLGDGGGVDNDAIENEGQNEYLKNVTGQLDLGIF